MRTLVGTSSLTPQPGGAAITVGTFDGVHLGHRALIARTLARAEELESSSVVVTWDRHPLATLRPDRVPPMITTPERKAELIAETGVDVLVVLPFDEAFSRLPPERFVADVLAALGARAVLVGEGWRFGHRAAGTVETLTAEGLEHGFSAESVSLAEVGGDRVSSTRVRNAITQGDMQLAYSLLGRPFDVDGLVLRGERRGTALGYPTANLAVDERFVHPPRGVYAGRAVTESGSKHVAAINVGVNPTFGGDPRMSPWRVESFLLDYSGDLYDQMLRIEVHQRLRDEEKFESVEALLEQMALDVEQTRKLVPA